MGTAHYVTFFKYVAECTMLGLEGANMGVLNSSSVHSDVVFVVDSSAALSGVFPNLLSTYILPCIE